jgi:ABC-type transporter Mla subunit MlaD
MLARGGAFGYSLSRMRRLFSLLLCTALIGGAGYWYYTGYVRCGIPLTYAIGEVDARFGLSEDEVREVVAEVAGRWEEVTGRDLFVYEPEDAALTIHFSYDDRQKLTEDEHALRDVLTRAENVSESIRGAYGELLTQYESLRTTYDTRIKQYEAELAAHNTEVAEWNEKGGAPEEVFGRLAEEERSLSEEAEELRDNAGELNTLVDRLNHLAEEGNEAVRDYNERVDVYNDRFNHEREFTQGDYQSGKVTIYQFADREELLLVLAHELGHALSLGHVEDPAAVMYYLMDGQDTALSFTDADIIEFERVCAA